MEREIKVKKYDFLGIVSSSLCLVHCMITPLLFAAQSFILEWKEEWEYIDYLFILLSLAAVYFAANHSKHFIIRNLLWIFYLLFLISMIFQHDYEWMKYMAYLSSIALAFTHILNIRYYNPKME